MPRLGGSRPDGLRNTEWLPLSREEGDDLAVVLPDVLPLRPNGGVPPPTSRTLIHYLKWTWNET